MKLKKYHLYRVFHIKITILFVNVIILIEDIGITDLVESADQI